MTILHKIIILLLSYCKIKNYLWPESASPDFLDRLQKRYNRVTYPSKFMLRGLTMRREQIDGCECITVTPRAQAGDTVVFYLHGGAFALPITSLHWQFITGTARKAGMAFVVPLYPRIPAATYKQIQHCIKAVYEEIIKRKHSNKIVAMGDSAGGNLALLLPFYVNEVQPAHIIAISPIVDVSLTNPKIDILDRIDPMLPANALRKLMPYYYADQNPIDSTVSPLYADYSAVKSKIHLLNAGKDILSPDITRLHKKLCDASIDHNYIYKKHRIHAWPIVMPGSTDEICKLLQQISRTS